MKRIHFSIIPLTALAYSHGRTETVLISGGRGKDPIRVNKSDFDADQDGDKNMSLYQGKDPTEGANTKGNSSDVNVTGENGVQTTAAPSAPNMSGDESTQPPIDETKQAAAPASTTQDQILVMKQGTGKNAKYFLTDGLGQKIEGDRAKQLGIDEDGYDTEAAAKEVQSNTEPSKAD